MIRLLPAIVLALGVISYLGFSAVTFQVGQWQQAILLQFGRPVRTVTAPGLHWKLPFVQNAEFIEKRLLEYDATPKELITLDKQQLVVDNFSRWRIVDAQKFYESVTNEAGAQSRLDDIIYSTLREELGRVTLRDVVSGDRDKLLAEITRKSNERAVAYGVEIVDVRIKRTELPAKNEANVFSRMRTERERQAKRFRAEGEEESRKIRSLAEKEQRVILAEASRKADIIRGEGDAEATKIYADAYNKNAGFYRFLRTLEAYEKSMLEGTTIVLSPDSEFFRLLQNSEVPK